MSFPVGGERREERSEAIEGVSERRAVSLDRVAVPGSSAVTTRRLPPSAVLVEMSGVVSASGKAPRSASSPAQDFSSEPRCHRPSGVQLPLACAPPFQALGWLRSSLMLHRNPSPFAKLMLAG